MEVETKVWWGKNLEGDSAVYERVFHHLVNLESSYWSNPFGTNSHLLKKLMPSPLIPAQYLGCLVFFLLQSLPLCLHVQLCRLLHLPGRHGGLSAQGVVLACLG